MTTINSNSSADITKIISNNSDISWNLSPQKLTKITLDLNMGKLTNNNTLTIDTGKFTGRAPKDRFIVKDKITSNSVDWGIINQEWVYHQWNWVNNVYLPFKDHAKYLILIFQKK